jgi:hypothetical protein
VSTSIGDVRRVPLITMDTVTSSNHGGFRPLWSSAPPPVGWRLTACYVLLLAPAIAGAAFEWHWAITAALLLPAIVLQSWLGYTRARALGIPRRTNVMPLRTRMVVGGFAGLAGALTDHIHPSYLAPLVFVLIVTVVLDPVWRIAWNRARTSAEGSLRPANTDAP